MRLIGISALVLFVLDQASKFVVLRILHLDTRFAIDVLPPFFNLRMAWNRGINFGLFANDAAVMRWALVALAVVIATVIAVWAARSLRHPLNHVLAGVLIGGALGNALDRVLHGAVVDFVNMSCCGIDNPYAFNLADAGIFAGALGLALVSGMLEKRA